MRKVAILGKLQTKLYAPFWDKEWDIWTINKDEWLPRVTLWFDLHYEPFKKDADITRANFPFKQIDLMLGGHYFNNTISYLIAYAILQGYSEIALFGMEFSTKAEIKAKQYENVRELIFYAKGKGIKITAPYDKIMLQEYPQYTKEFVENRKKEYVKIN